jgi:hypothetical protein
MCSRNPGQDLAQKSSKSSIYRKQKSQPCGHPYAHAIRATDLIRDCSRTMLWFPEIKQCSVLLVDLGQKERCSFEQRSSDKTSFASEILVQLSLFDRSAGRSKLLYYPSSRGAGIAADLAEPADTLQPVQLVGLW